MIKDKQIVMDSDRKKLFVLTGLSF